MDIIKTLLGKILYGIYMLLNAVGVPYGALCIILFTILVKALMLPLNIKQQKSSRLSSVMNPEIQKVQAKYKGKKDRESLEKSQKEMQVIYDKYGTSPTAGCLPLLITLPILWALYGVINNMAQYIAPIGDMYNNIIDKMKEFDYDKYKGVMEELAKNNKVKYDGEDQILDVLQKLSRSDWVKLHDHFDGLKKGASCASVIKENSDKIVNFNSFLGGLNISESPTLKDWKSMFIPILAVLTQWYQTKQMQAPVANKNSKDDNSTMQSMQTMTKVMPLISGAFCMGLPIGVGIYWISGSCFQIVQQYFVNKKLDAMNIDEMISENVARTNKKKSSLSDRLKKKLLESAENASENGSDTNKKTLGNFANIDVKNVDSDDKVSNKSADNSSSKDNDKIESATVKEGSSSKEVNNEKVSKKGSISSYANIMSTNDTK